MPLTKPIDPGPLGGIDPSHDPPKRFNNQPHHRHLLVATFEGNAIEGGLPRVLQKRYRLPGGPRLPSQRGSQCMAVMKRTAWESS